MSQLIRIDQLTIDPKLQPRQQVNEALVEEYREVWASGTRLPAVEVVSDGVRHWLVDGFHRVLAATRAGLAEIEASSTEGNYRTAILLACAANATHGLRRSAADKRRQVVTLLKDKEWRQWSDSQIANQCVVSTQLVKAVRDSLTRPAPTVRRYRTAQGKVATMNIAPIIEAARERADPAPVIPPVPIVASSLQDLLTLSFARMRGLILSAQAEWEQLHTRIHGFPHAQGFKGYLAVKNLFDTDVPYLVKSLRDARPLEECTYCHGEGECLPCGKSRLLTEAQAKQVRRL